jgi:16S rRNA (uracil1498-N3)-methyltransferase
VFCDEDAEVKDPVAALTAVRPQAGAAPPLAVLIGPEGGFAEDERTALALALVQATLGDWR